MPRDERRARLKQRSGEYRKTVGHLADALAAIGPDPRIVELAGLVQLFELSVELGWKSLALWLDLEGVDVQVVAPQPVLRQAHQANLIGDGDMWMEALRTRNIMSHAYDVAAFGQLTNDLRDRFLPILLDLDARIADHDRDG